MPDTPVAIVSPALTDSHHLARGAAVNTLVLIAANFRGVFTFLIARLLGQAAIGRFGLAFLILELLSKAGTLGLDSGLVPAMAPRAAAGDGGGCRRVFRRAIAMGAAASAVLALAAIVLVPSISSALGSDAFARGGTLMMLALPGIAVTRISFAASRALLSMRNELYARGLTETWVTIGVFLAAIAIGVRDQAPALAVVSGITASAIVAFALATRALARLPSGDRRQESSREALDAPSFRPAALLRFSLPIAGTNLLSVLVTQADVLLLLLYVGRVPGVTLERVGVFWVAAELAVGLRKVRQIFDPILVPVLATRAAADNALVKETVAAPARWVLSAQLPLVGVLLLSGGAILRIYGEGFPEGALWLALLGLAHGTNTFAGLADGLLMVRRPALNLTNAIVTVAVQLVAGVILIPRFGITGAAAAMCAGFGVQSVLRFLEVRQVYGWSWPWAALVRPVAAFAVAFAPAALLRVFSVGLIMEAAAGLLFLGLYAAAWWKIGAEPADREVWTRLRAASRRPGREIHVPQ